MLVFLLSTRYSCQILMKRMFSTEFRKIRKHKISRKSVQWEQSCPMRTDVRTDGHEDANSLFRNFPNAPKNDVLECLTGTLYSMQCHICIEVSDSTEYGRNTNCCTQMLTLKTISTVQHVSCKTELYCII